ncbi:nuclease [Methanosarcinales archaeon]|nr:MAG: nuclease [Methanosarcinales archaeon]
MYTYKAKLVRVIDGDSVVLDIDLGLNVWQCNEHCRLYGINTPEIRGGTPETKAAGFDAKIELAELIANSDGKLIIRTHLDKEGKFGRLLVILHHTEDIELKYSFNDLMVKSGHAEYKIY